MLPQEHNALTSPSAAQALTDRQGRALHRSRFIEVWHAAQERGRGDTEAGTWPAPQQDGYHALPHTAASAWQRAGIDAVRVADWLGDTPQVVLQTYAHLMPGDSGDDGRAATEAFFASPRVGQMCTMILLNRRVRRSMGYPATSAGSRARAGGSRPRPWSARTALLRTPDGQSVKAVSLP